MTGKLEILHHHIANERKRTRGIKEMVHLS
jgi:hypothetical protein